MRRVGSAWAPDGRAKAIRADCEASLASLDGLSIDLYLIHAPDPRTPWRTSVRALARLVEEGLVRGVGVSNVNRRAARRGARARTARRGRGLAEPPRRPGDPGRRRRALPRGRVGADRALAPRRPAPGCPAGTPIGARRDREPARRDTGGGRARLARRPDTWRRGNPGGSAAGVRALGRPRRDARVERR